MWVVRAITGPPLTDYTIQNATTGSIADFSDFIVRIFFQTLSVLMFSSPRITCFTTIWEKDKGPRYLGLYYALHYLSPKFLTFANILCSLLQNSIFGPVFHQGRGREARGGSQCPQVLKSQGIMYRLQLGTVFPITNANHEIWIITKIQNKQTIVSTKYKSSAWPSFSQLAPH